MNRVTGYVSYWPRTVGIVDPTPVTDKEFQEAWENINDFQVLGNFIDELMAAITTALSDPNIKKEARQALTSYEPLAKEVLKMSRLIGVELGLEVNFEKFEGPYSQELIDLSWRSISSANDVVMFVEETYDALQIIRRGKLTSEQETLVRRCQPLMYRMFTHMQKLGEIMARDLLPA